MRLARVGAVLCLCLAPILSAQGAVKVGRDAITAVAQGFMTACPDLKIVMDDLVINGDPIAYHWTLIGTNTDPGATGKRLHIRGFEEWRIGEAGLIAESRGHFDAAEYERQLERDAMEFR